MGQRVRKIYPAVRTGVATLAMGLALWGAAQRTLEGPEIPRNLVSSKYGMYQVVYPSEEIVDDKYFKIYRARPVPISDHISYITGWKDETGTWHINALDLGCADGIPYGLVNDIYKIRGVPPCKGKGLEKFLDTIAKTSDSIYH